MEPAQGTGQEKCGENFQSSANSAEMFALALVNFHNT
jgi:hypothetical protein